MAGGGSKPGERRGGRQKGTPNKSSGEMRELAQAYGPKALATIVRLMDSQDDDMKLRASQTLLDRGYGKPSQQLQHAGHDGGPLDLHSMSDEDLDKLASRLASGIDTNK